MLFAQVETIKVDFELWLPGSALDDEKYTAINDSASNLWGKPSPTPEKNPVGPLLDNSQPFGQHNGRTTKSTTIRGGGMAVLENKFTPKWTWISWKASRGGTV